MAKKRLDSLKSCRAYLAAAVNQMDAGQMSEAEGKARGYIVKIIGELIETGDIESRVTELEKLFKARGDK